MMRDPRFDFELHDIFDPLARDATVIFKKMFGGLAVYSGGRLVAALMEDPTDHEWKGKKYDYAIWYGLLVPTSHEHHASLIEELPDLRSHPVLAKWLYLPFVDESDFRATARRVVTLILRQDPRIGVEPSRKKRRKKK